MACSDSSCATTPASLPENRPICLGKLDRGVQKPRRIPSTSGGRAWTEEEESYLLRTRMQKMPYKHISAYLHKTELACRLHYHQMTYGNNRKRRAGSLCSSSSLDSTFHPVEDSSSDHKSTASSPAPQPSPGLASVSGSPLPSIRHISSRSRTHIPILPKPVISSSEKHSQQLQSQAQTRPESYKQLHFSTPATRSEEQAHRSPGREHYIDSARLRSLYDSHRDSFWAFLATEYSKGGAIPGHKLEEAFFNDMLSPFQGPSPPTPRPSPLIGSQTVYKGSPRHENSRFLTPPPPLHRPGGFHAVNEPQKQSSPQQRSQSPVQKCAVASLLTVEKEVWASKEIRSA
ncbi:hypothetical protein FQN57_001877 [Myotisia sp. PD_48]|nr:hypothetical protein FQN57_001877 [Myotisia sp. PD_48]